MSTAVISPLHDDVPLHAGTATLPNGCVSNGHLYIATHVNSMFEIWKPPGWIPCGATEVQFLYRQKLDKLTEPFEFVGQISPCMDFLGRGYWGQETVICSTTKNYAFTNRVRGTVWTDEDFGNVYIGSNNSPNLPRYNWMRTPLLANSTVGGRRIAWLFFPGIRSFATDPPSPLREFARQWAEPFGPMQLWGYMRWGYVDEGPHRMARVQIAEYAGADSKPKPETTLIRVLAEDGRWQVPGPGGVVDFVPWNAADDFPELGLPDSIFHHPVHGWCGVGHATRPPEPGDPGPNIDEAWWYKDPRSQFYNAPWAHHSGVPRYVKLGGGITHDWEALRTKAACLIGAYVHGGHLFQGSSERIAYEDPDSWKHGWLGAEIVVTEIT